MAVGLLNMRRPFLPLLTLCAVTACTPRLVTVERVRSDSVWIRTTDSVFLLDSVHVTERRAGDTVYLTKERWRWRDRFRHDTVRLFRSDSVPVPVRVTQEVPRPFFAELRSSALALCLPLLLALLCLVAWKRR